MRWAAIALAMLLAGGIGYELGHLRGYRAAMSFESRWCAATASKRSSP